LPDKQNTKRGFTPQKKERFLMKSRKKHVFSRDHFSGAYAYRDVIYGGLRISGKDDAHGG
jgi:hypothetical protein